MVIEAQFLPQIKNWKSLLDWQKQGCNCLFLSFFFIDKFNHSSFHVLQIYLLASSLICANRVFRVVSSGVFRAQSDVKFGRPLSSWFLSLNDLVAEVSEMRQMTATFGSIKENPGETCRCMTEKRFTRFANRSNRGNRLFRLLNPITENPRQYRVVMKCEYHLATRVFSLESHGGLFSNCNAS